MKKYPKYKDSGVSWIGEVPSHWKHCRFKNFLSLVNFPSTDENKIGLENIESGTGRFIETKSEFEGNGLQYIKNDIVYGKLRPYLRKVWLATNKGNAVGDFFVFRAKKSNASYVKWLMLSDGFTSETNGSTFGAKMPRVSSDFILSLHYFLPPPSEQRAIASFLDAKTEQIDRFIAEAEKEIEKLNELKQAQIAHLVTHGLNPDVPMKNSEIAWIGQIPAHWEVRKIRSHFKERRIKVSDKDYPALSVAREGIVPQLETAVKTDNGDNRKLVLKNDFVVNSRSDRKGSCGVSDYDGSVSLISIVLEPRDIYSKYAHHLFRSNNYIEEFYRNGRGIVADLWTTRYSEMKNIFMPIPPNEEQVSIVSAINSISEKIDTLTTKLNAQIGYLKELKQRIISDAVTGKVRVR